MGGDLTTGTVGGEDFVKRMSEKKTLLIVGGKEMNIIVVEYDPNWKNEYLKEEHDWVSNLALKNNNLLKLVQGTVKKFIDPNAEVLSIESTPITMGLQAVELRRHIVLIKILDDTSKLSLVSKNATRIERQVLTRLYSQKASVPFSLSYGSEAEERSLICIQDVDYQTDYRNINKY